MTPILFRPMGLSLFIVILLLLLIYCPYGAHLFHRYTAAATTNILSLRDRDFMQKNLSEALGLFLFCNGRIKKQGGISRILHRFKI